MSSSSDPALPRTAALITVGVAAALVLGSCAHTDEEGVGYGVSAP